MSNKIYEEGPYKLTEREYKWYRYLMDNGLYGAFGWCVCKENRAIAATGAKSLAQMEERIENLEMVISAIVSYRFPDGNQMSYGGTFTLGSEFDGSYATDLEKKAYKIIKERGIY